MADEPVLNNDPAARTDTGELKNQASTPTPDSTKTDSQAASTTPTDTTAKPADAKPDDPSKALLNKDAKPDKAAVQGAPEKYEAFKVPDGFEMPEAVSTEAGKLFKELNLSQDQAQRLVDFYAAKNTEAAEAPYKLMDEMRSTWRKEILSDAKFGDGANLKPEVASDISKFIDQMGPEAAGAFREAMNLTGTGDHPGFFKGMYALAQKYGEGKLVKGSGPSPLGQTAPGAAPRSAAAAIFPNLPSASRQG